jgi:hypothetical protein
MLNLTTLSQFQFHRRLVADVLGADGTTGEHSVPMDKVVMLIWQFRDDPTVVTFMARFVAKVRFPELSFFILAFMDSALNAHWCILVCWLQNSV